MVTITKPKRDSSPLEGSGAADGVVLPLQLVGSGIYDAVYTLQVKIGKSKSFSLQVDTGSSDLWVASTSCSTSSCSSIGSSDLYNPSSSSATQTSATFNISYLLGSVSGPVVWDHVQIGGYTIDNQALAAASSVTDEPLSSSFSGILGLALPLNSVIATLIPPVTDNSPDGAAWASNLFSLTPPSTPPSSHFLSLSLSRPGSDRIPALLGIGHHPSSIVSDPSKILYSSLVSDSAGTLFWKVSVQAITVYVDGEQKPINIGRSNSGMVFPTAVLDSGIPYILTTSNVANAIYGALGIGPSSDGHYYVPCSTPLNMTITLDNRPEIPLHPLDLTAEPADNNQAQYCVGMIQVASQLSNPSYGVGDIILGVPFLRNTYTVMAYVAPNKNGSFQTPSNNNINDNGEIQPRLGLLALTDPVVALNEFHIVRVLNEPIPNNGGGSPNNGSTSSPSGSGSDGKKLSDGLIVLISLLGFFTLCIAVFLVLRRSFRGLLGGNKIIDNGGGGPGSGGVGSANNAVLSQANTQPSIVPLPVPPPTASTNVNSLSSTAKSRTSKKPVQLLSYSPLGAFSASFEDVRLEGTLAPANMTGADGDSDESSKEDETLVVRPRVPPRGVTFPTERINSDYTMSSGKTYCYTADLGEGKKRGANESFGSKWSAGEITLSGGRGGGQHERFPSVSAPLLSHQHRRSHSYGSEPERPVIGVLDVVEFGWRPSRVYRDSIAIPGPRASTAGDAPTNDNANTSMAGIGSAARARRRLEQFDALPFPRTSSYYSTRGSVVTPEAAAIAPTPTPADDPEDTGWRPEFLPFPPSSSSPPPITRTDSPTELEKPLPPLPPSPPPSPPPSSPLILFPSMSGLRMPDEYTRTSWIDEFDPYLESTATSGPR